MASENKVSVEITLEEKAALTALTKLTKQVQNTEDGFTKMGKEGDKSLGVVSNAAKGVSEGFGSLVKGVTVANLASTAIIGTANAVKEFVAGSIAAAVGQENAINRLNQSLRAAGDFSISASEDLQAFSTEMQQISVHGDEVVIGQLAVAKAFGASNEQAKQLVQAAANLSATFGGSLESNVEKLGKTFSGEAGRLAQYIPAIKNLTAEQLKAGEAFAIVNTKYDGAAANELNTYQGRVTSLANAYSDLQEELGLFITTSNSANGTTGFLKGIFEELGVALKNTRIELARGSEGFQESQDTVNQLSGKYEELTQKIEEARAVIAVRDDPNSGFFASMFANAERAKEQLQQLIPLQKEIYAQINAAQAAASTNDTATAQDGSTKAGKTASPADDARVLKEAQVQIEIARIREEARIAAEEQNALVYEATLGNRELEVEEVYAFEMQKLEAQYEAEEAKANLIKDSTEKRSKLQEVAAKKELDATKLYNNQLKAEQQRKIKDQEAINAGLLVSTSNFLAAGQLLAKDGSNAQKALQITQATISTYAAANNALAQPVPYPVAVAMAASAVALGLANVAKIAGAKFEYGGIVGGNSMTGDTVSARVNSGEMILNRQQQTSLFNQINSSGSQGGSSDQIERLITAINSQTISLTLDGREIARSVRSQVQQGFKLTA